MSVRFYKRIFLLILLAIVFIPASLAVGFGVSRAGLTARNHILEEKLEVLERELAEARQALQTAAGLEEAAAPGPGQVAAEPIGYQLLYPDLYSDAVLPAERVRQEGVVYLTFDDGPYGQTDGVLDILEAEGIKATFFVNGHSGENAEARLKRILSDGHTLGLHSETHDYQLIYRSVEDYLDDFYALYQRVYGATGYRAQIFRFPGGSVNSYDARIYQELIGEMTRRGFVFFDWNASAQDAVEGISSREVTRNVLSSLEGKKRAIVLLHDAGGGTATLEALPDIIAGIRARGYEFATLTPEILPVSFGYQ